MVKDMPHVASIRELDSLQVAYILRHLDLKIDSVIQSTKILAEYDGQMYWFYIPIFTYELLLYNMWTALHDSVVLKKNAGAIDGARAQCTGWGAQMSPGQLSTTVQPEGCGRVIGFDRKLHGLIIY